jgi:hypothetical protein
MPARVPTMFVLAVESGGRAGSSLARSLARSDSFTVFHFTPTETRASSLDSRQVAD